MQSWMALLIAGMLIGPVAGSTVAYADTTVPTETQIAVNQAVDQWNGHLGIRQQCSAGVSIVFEELSGRRGEYRTGSGEVVIDPVDSPDGLGAIVVHELSHHTFLACGAFADADLTAAFYAAQGIPTGRDWFDYSAGWAQAPAEHFAEALATLIVGGGEGGISIDSETIGLLSRWLSGAPITPAVAETRNPIPYSSGGASADPVAVSERGAELPETNQQVAAPPPVAPSQDNPEGDLDDVMPEGPIARVFRLHSWRVI